MKLLPILLILLMFSCDDYNDEAVFHNKSKVINGVDGKDGSAGAVGKTGSAGKDGTNATSPYEVYRSLNQVLWLPSYVTDIDRTYRFEEGMSGYYQEYPNGTARITGVLRGVNDPEMGFQIDIQVRGKTQVAPAGSPKLGNNTDADISDWHYYETTTGILTGTGKLAGLKLKITRNGPAFQVGVGANYHDMDFGASVWVYYEILSNSKCEDYQIYVGDKAWQRADINLDLVEIK